jgi:hypothetical protein
MIKKVITAIIIKRKIHKNLKKNGFSRKKLKKDFEKHMNRKLDIREILSRDYSVFVIVDAYEYCMRKCNWEPSALKPGAMKDFLLCMDFSGWVGNGGISQFIENTSDDMIMETIEALKTIDDVFADLLTSAVQLFPNGVIPENQDFKIQILNDLREDTDKRMLDIDTAAYMHDDTRNFYHYLQLHKSDFLDF